MAIDHELKEHPFHEPIILDNARCPYCGVDLDDANSTKEHVVGRRFVPRGKFNGQWNLIVNACRVCNGIKADLEDDISAITMQPDAWGRHAIADEALAAEARRKAKSISRRTKRPVADSVEQLKVEVPFIAGATASITLTGPPQPKPERVYELARLQVAGFFHWVTYDEATRQGGYYLGSFCPLLEANRADWGNPAHRAFMKQVVQWEPRVLAVGADGYFRIAIRRHPSLVCWSWALEWNHNLRIVGYIGELELLKKLATLIPHPTARSFAEGPNRWIRYRNDEPLEEDQDEMFVYQEIAA